MRYPRMAIGWGIVMVFDDLLVDGDIVHYYFPIVLPPFAIIFFEVMCINPRM